jgi:SAM-dependent methyltransferase
MPASAAATFDWTKVSGDPSCPAVREALLTELRQCRRPAFTGDKYQVIREFVEGKRVLDLGVVDHTADVSEKPHWLHGRIRGWAKETVGVDILEKEVAILRTRGYDIVAADATSDVDLGRRFERVVMGDLIEHVSDPVKLLKFAARHLQPGGRILSTTPNPFYFAWLYESMRLGACIANAEHVMWAGPTMMLELARRAGVRLVEYRLLRVPADQPTWRTKIMEALSERYFREQELFAQSYAYTFEGLGPSASS